MSVKPRIYVPGQDANMDKVLELYQHLDNSPKIMDRDETAEERSVNDPFGFGAVGKTPKGDPWYRAKGQCEKLINFLNLLIAETGMTPEEAIFAQELMSLNVLNSPDQPIPAARVAEVRKAAFEYYAQHRP